MNADYDKRRWYEFHKAPGQWFTWGVTGSWYVDDACLGFVRFGGTDIEVRVSNIINDPLILDNSTYRARRAARHRDIGGGVHRVYLTRAPSFEWVSTTGEVVKTAVEVRLVKRANGGVCVDAWGINR